MSTHNSEQSKIMIGSAFREISKLADKLLLILSAAFALPGWRIFATANHVAIWTAYGRFTAICVVVALFLAAISLFTLDFFISEFSAKNVVKYVVKCLGIVLVRALKYGITGIITAFLFGFFLYAYNRANLLCAWALIAAVYIVTHIVGHHLCTSSVIVEGIHSSPNSPLADSTEKAQANGPS